MLNADVFQNVQDGSLNTIRKEFQIDERRACKTATKIKQRQNTNNVKHKIKDVDKHVPKTTSDETIDFKTNGSKRRPGILQPIAASMLMQLLYATRVARPDFLKCVRFFAKRVNLNRWDKKQ